jgi:DNA-directed RNA polymerase subunit RPC12/RpoP
MRTRNPEDSSMNRGPFDPTSVGRQPSRQADFDEFEATELYCTKCGRAVPVRKSLLLILPEGDKYEYRCRFCGHTVGDKIDRSAQHPGILKI